MALNSSAWLRLWITLFLAWLRWNRIVVIIKQLRKELLELH